MSVVEDEKEIKKLRRFIARFGDSRALTEQVKAKQSELAGRIRRLSWLRARLSAPPAPEPSPSPSLSQSPASSSPER